MTWRRAAVRMNFCMIANAPLSPTAQLARIGPVSRFHDAVCLFPNSIGRTCLGIQCRVFMLRDIVDQDHSRDSAIG
ncbi:hypothetical protein BDR03DRAFT_954284 [Suillus americanus]|nr:hypothetical protein BDR03DRAFT_954284 [Suillus americanus]